MGSTISTFLSSLSKIALVNALVEPNTEISNTISYTMVIISYKRACTSKTLLIRMVEYFSMNCLNTIAITPITNTVKTVDKSIPTTSTFLRLRLKYDKRSCNCFLSRTPIISYLSPLSMWNLGGLGTLFAFFLETILSSSFFSSLTSTS